jgi:hypothetical protein
MCVESNVSHMSIFLITEPWMMAAEPLHEDTLFNPQLGFSCDPLYHDTIVKTCNHPKAAFEVIPPAPESTLSRMSSARNEHRPTFYIPLDKNVEDDSDPENVKYIRSMYKELFFETKISGPFNSHLITASDLVLILTGQFSIFESTEYSYTFSVDGDGDAADMMVVKIHLVFSLGKGRLPIEENHTLYFKRFLTTAEKKQRKELAKYNSECRKYEESISILKRQLAELQESIGKASQTIETLESENKKLRLSQESMQSQIEGVEKSNTIMSEKFRSTLGALENIYSNMKQFQLPQTKD